MSHLTQDRLKDVLTYDAATGVFRWLKRTGSSAAGNEAGCAARNGYLSVRVDGVLYAAHRLAWFYVNGTWPSGHIDHINRNKLDNRISNLRVCNDLENGQNTNISKANKSGVTGVWFNPKVEKWHAQIMVNRKNLYLGRYQEKESAIKARKMAEEKYFPFRISADRAIAMEQVHDSD